MAMNDIVRQRLKGLVQNHGDHFYLDGRLCRSLLADRCPTFKKEIAVLVAAVEEGLTSSLLKSARAPTLLVIAKLVRHLEEERSITVEAASWAVWSWAWAMDIVDETTFNKGVSTEGQKMLQQALHETAIPIIKIISPRGGEKWLAGQAHAVQWTYSGSPSCFKIELLKRGKIYKCIVDRYPATITQASSFSYKWEIPKSESPSNRFKIRISSLEVEYCEGRSASDFTVWSEQFHSYLEVFKRSSCSTCRRFYTTPLLCPEKRLILECSSYQPMSVAAKLRQWEDDTWWFQIGDFVARYRQTSDNKSRLSR